MKFNYIYANDIDEYNKQIETEKPMIIGGVYNSNPEKYITTKAYLDSASRESESYFEDDVIEQEMFMLVHKAIEVLPPQMRTIIHYAMDGLKNPQIALEMGIAEGTVHSLKKTAYRKLREQLQEHFYLLLFM